MSDGGPDPATSLPDRRWCTACGAPLGAADRFCGACGTAVGEAGAERTGPPPRTPSRLTLVTIAFGVAAVVVGAVAAALWLGGDGEPSTRTIVGAVTAIDEGYDGSVGEACGVGDEAFRPTVTVTPGESGEAGAVTAEASDGRISQLFQCRFTFALTGLADADAYRFQLEGGEARVLTRAQLEADGWQVETSIGGLGG